MKEHIFITEDDENISELIKCSLETFDYKVKVFPSGEALLYEVEKNIPKLILLDVMLPKMDGLEILTRLKSSKRTGDIPIIMVTAKGMEFDKVKALEIGADDYVVKPFSVLELCARIKSLLRRVEKQESEPVLTYLDICVNINTYQVKVGGEDVELTKKEFKLLVILLENKDRVITRNELLDRVWGYDFEGESRTLDMHIKTLRSKLSKEDKYKYIKTLRGVGYKVN